MLMDSKSTHLYLRMVSQAHHHFVMPSSNRIWRPSDPHDLFQSPAMPPVVLELLQEPLKPGGGGVWLRGRKVKVILCKTNAYIRDH